MCNSNDGESGEKMMSSRHSRSISWLNGEPMRIKILDMTRVVLDSEVVKYLAGLRGIRHENINTCMGCYMAPNRFGLVYDYCQRGSLQAIDIPFL
nr:hypothetical transcript [Hymenolepis microstoma]